MTDVSESIDLDELRRLAEAATPIRDAPGYVVTVDGDVLSTATNWRGYGVRRLTPIEGRSGYLKVRLTVDGRRINRMVHRIVAEAYLSPRPVGAQVRHLDGDKLNNSATNLAWGSALDNAHDRAGHGTTARGERNGWARIDESKVLEVRALRKSGLLYREIEQIAGVSRWHARQIVTREVWAHVD